MSRIYQAPHHRAAQINRWLRRATSGSVNGHSESASNVKLDKPTAITTRQVGSGSTTILEASGETTTDVYTANGTWSKPAGALIVRMYVLSGGAGGASGTTGAAGTQVLGGIGGDGGGMSTATYDAADVPSTLTITVGGGGSGGVHAGGGSVLGTSGGASSASASGLNYVHASGGRALANVGTGTTQAEYSGGRRGIPGNTPTAPARLAFFGNGGAAGGTITTANVAGAGGSVILATPEIGKFGTTLMPAHGGNGGNSSTSGNGGNGTNGDFPGGGGGGGGACRPGSTPGSGGAGAAGLVVIVTTTA